MLSLLHYWGGNAFTSLISLDFNMIVGVISEFPYSTLSFKCLMDISYLTGTKFNLWFQPLKLIFHCPTSCSCPKHKSSLSLSSSHSSYQIHPQQLKLVPFSKQIENLTPSSPPPLSSLSKPLWSLSWVIESVPNWYSCYYSFASPTPASCSSLFSAQQPF